MKKDKANIIINGESNYDSVLIFCHGLGDNSSSWIYFAIWTNNYGIEHFQPTLLPVWGGFLQ